MIPDVTAVMITGKHWRRLGAARVAVKCFLEQTYTDSKLLILNDGEERLAFIDDRVEEVQIRETNRLTLGELRNRALSLVDSPWIIQWDDDDWHHPDRIAIQRHYAELGGAVLLKSQIRLNILNDSAYIWCNAQGIEGTILHSSDPDLRYPSQSKGEDTAFLSNFSEHLIVENDPCTYVRCFHGDNTWNEKHIMRELAGRHDTWKLDERAKSFVQSKIRPLYAEQAGICRGDALKGPESPNKVHFGCGVHRIEGWLNYDKEVDIRNALPFADCSVEVILAEHVLEHIEPPQGWKFLEESFRILKPGGTVRIIVPSIERIYANADDRFLKEMSTLAKIEPTLKDVIWCSLSRWGHRAVWVRDSLVPILNVLGFSTKEESPGCSLRPELRGIDQHHKTVGTRINEVESLIIDATKPLH